MDCREAREALNAFVDDELAPERSFEVDKHLERCAACRAEADEIRALDARVREVCRADAGGAASPALRARLGAAIDAAGAPDAAGAARRGRGRALRVLGSIAASVVLAVGVALLLFAAPSSAQAFADDHVKCGKHMLEAGPRLTDPAEIARTCCSTCRCDAQVVCLEAAGYKLIGAGVCTLGGREHVHCLYRNAAGEVVSVFAAPPGDALAARLGAERAGDLDVLRFRCPRNGVDYVLVVRAGEGASLRDLIARQVADSR